MGSVSELWVKGEYFDDLAAVGLAARGTLDRHAQFFPLDRLRWFRSLQSHGRAQGHPLVVRARTEGADVWLFLARLEKGVVTALAGPDDAVFQPIYSGGPDVTTRRRLLRAVAKRLKRPSFGIRRLSLPQVAGHATPALTAALRRAGWMTFATPAGERWSASPDERMFDEFWQGRPGRLRSLVDGQAGRSPVQVEILEQADDRAWAALGGDNPMLRDLAEGEALAGRLRIGLALLDGTVLAAQLWTVEHGGAVLHAIAGDEDLVHHLLSSRLFRRLIDVDGAQLILLATADPGVMADWMEERHPLSRIDAYNLRNPAAWLPAAKAALSALVRRPKLD